ncbi:hypothetical protein AWM70_18055 [Paenibacillus yonginensis]|uniref:Uncharacterized protein n=1 Tax=Paenibacillus yonginensis TaxID=1462996 RepID=A0A1B1N4C2_9BACL|nr:hypothetical protein [Paenibacillus yonginensis]ANS76252.1 hypothetical protein AWM70_18055 [Paenibacillus yonginensis]
MPLTAFDTEYGQADSKPDALSKEGKNAAIDLQNIQVENNNISFTAALEYNNQHAEISASGKLYKSSKQKDGVNSVVGDIQDKTNTFNFLLFEVYNDSSRNKVTTINSAIIDSNFSHKPHMNIYLTDASGNLLLFEIPIPKELSKLSVSNNDQIEPTKDYAWFINVLKPHEPIIVPATPEALQAAGLSIHSDVSILAVNGYSDWADNLVTYRETLGGTPYQWTTLAYGTWKAADVTGQNTWTNTFKISESTTINGIVVPDVNNLLRFRNVTLTNAVGAKSSISRSFVQGQLDGKSNGSSLAMLVGNKIWSTALPAAPSLSDIQSWITAVNNALSSKTVTLGSSGTVLNSGPVVTQSADSASYEMFRKTADANGNTLSNGHYLTLQSDVQFEQGSTTATSATANGMMTIKWDIYTASTKYSSESKTISFQYNVKKN